MKTKLNLNPKTISNENEMQNENGTKQMLPIEKTIKSETRLRKTRNLLCA